MSNESKTLEKEAQAQAEARQPWTARRVGDLILNNALIIIMILAVIYIAIINENFLKAASTSTSSLRPRPICPPLWVSPDVSS